MHSFTTLLLAAAGAAASPLLRAKQSITALSNSQITPFTPYSYFAAAGYCSPSSIMSWSCGTNCNGNSGFEPVAAGGDGDAVQYWYVGYNPSSSEIIVAHQGTQPQELLSDYTDVHFELENLDATLFPNLDSSIEAHSGFAAEQAKTATDVLAAVQQAMNTYGATQVTMLGHSLGAAIALLDTVYLPLWLPSGTTFTTVCYGLPRVGNQAFANYIDANADLTHINNKEDPIPIVPGMFLGFVHASGELHIQDSNAWDACPGQDNPSTLCIVGDVPEIYDGDLSDHDGPYNGVTMGSSGCS